MIVFASNTCFKGPKQTAKKIKCIKWEFCCILYVLLAVHIFQENASMKVSMKLKENNSSKSFFNNNYWNTIYQNKQGLVSGNFRNLSAGFCADILNNLFSDHIFCYSKYF